MAVKVRCSDCKKQIAVDEAFAGSMCRCPYCKSIIMVPDVGTQTGDTRTSKSQKRPDKPGGGRSRRKKPGFFAKKIMGKGREKNVVGAAPIIDKSSMPVPRIMPGQNSKTARQRSRPGKDQRSSSGGAVSSSNKPAGLPIVGGSGLRSTIPEGNQTDEFGNFVGSGLSGSGMVGSGLSGSGMAGSGFSGSGLSGSGLDSTYPEAIPRTVHVDASKLSNDELASIPTAAPVRMQGIFSLILIAVVIVLVLAGVYWLIQAF